MGAEVGRFAQPLSKAVMEKWAGRCQPKGRVQFSRPKASLVSSLRPAREVRRSASITPSPGHEAGGEKGRVRAEESFADHYSQARQFFPQPNQFEPRRISLPALGFLKLSEGWRNVPHVNARRSSLICVISKEDPRQTRPRTVLALENCQGASRRLPVPVAGNRGEPSAGHWQRSSGKNEEHPPMPGGECT